MKFDSKNFAINSYIELSKIVFLLLWSIYIMQILNYINKKIKYQIDLLAEIAMFLSLRVLLLLLAYHPARVDFV